MRAPDVPQLLRVEGSLSTDGLLDGEDNQLTRAVQCLQDGVAA